MESNVDLEINQKYFNAASFLKILDYQCRFDTGSQHFRPLAEATYRYCRIPDIFHSFTMAFPETIKTVAKTIFKPNTAWVFLFIPALFYYVGTRLYSLGLFRSSTCGEIVPHELTIWTSTLSSSLSSLALGADFNPLVSEEACSEFIASNHKAKDKLFYIQKSRSKNKDSNNNSGNCRSLRYPLYLVRDDFDDASIVATTWMEDEELGRGYLLLSTSAGNGRIYRWEAGGGPIAIGRTLHLKDSGCRSNIYRKCGVGIMNVNANSPIGSGGIAVDIYRSKDPEPHLIVAEYGEGRVVRLEENGARTPLIIETATKKRLTRPFRLLTTPYGDLLAMDNATRSDYHSGGDDDNDDNNKGSFVLWRLPKASDVPALPSLAASRKAHAWNRNNNTMLPHVFFQSNEMGGMVLDPSGQRILVTTRTMDPGDNSSSSVVVVSLPLLDDLDDQEESNKNGDLVDDNGKIISREMSTRQSILVFDYSAHAKAPGAIEVDNNGNIYLAVENGILVVSKSRSYFAKVAFSAGEKIVDLTLGSDKFLYVAMESKLARIRVPNSPLQVQKDLLIKA